TGVQTWALPISAAARHAHAALGRSADDSAREKRSPVAAVHPHVGRRRRRSHRAGATRASVRRSPQAGELRAHHAGRSRSVGVGAQDRRLVCSALFSGAAPTGCVGAPGNTGGLALFRFYPAPHRPFLAERREPPGPSLHWTFALPLLRARVVHAMSSLITEPPNWLSCLN